ncbi:MAG TPA: hypothetical protein VE959_18065 [Bryobacteraceae bacterium]|nr:hypothetical protein [Bryobacteraceae bacterium]
MPSASAYTSGRPFGRAGALLAPSLADLFVAILLAAEFGQPASWLALLSDGDTGWHIRTGDFILRSGAVPLRDLFSFSRPDQPWYAWEWLADVIFALLHRWHGLEAVAVFTAIVLSATGAILLMWLLRRGAGLWIAVAVVLAAVSASTVHHLARPHMFSPLFLTLALWLLDEDRRSPGARVWVLAPMSALWANLHGGFVCGLAVVAMLAAIRGAERKWAAARRYGALAAWCSAATLVNPYGWHLHQHILKYLGSSWILNNVQEFQSPQIRSESMLVFAALLLLGTALASRAFARGQWFEGALVMAWGFAALRSARHVPLFAVAAAPLIASECADSWARAAGSRPARSAIRVWWVLSQELGRSRRVSPWSAVFAAVVLLAVLPRGGLADFPAARFPVSAVARNRDLLEPDGAMPHILTSDQWADYLIFHLYPRQRVFFDGRSDFYGPGVGGDYQALLAVGPRWRSALDRYGFEIALLPLDWPLGVVLEGDPGWRVADRDAVSVLLIRRDPGVKENGETADRGFVGEYGREDIRGPDSGVHRGGG